MRIVYIAVLGVLAITAGFQCAVASVKPVYLVVSARSKEGYSSVNSVYEKEAGVEVSVDGGVPFELILESSYPLSPAEMHVAFSDGQVLEASNGICEYQCDYLIRYYGLGIALYPDGSIDVFPFEMGPSWWPEDLHLIPYEFPEVTRPVSPNPDIDSLIGVWWADHVVPVDAEWRGSFFEDMEPW
jgi:hypothetical protein